MSQALCFNDVRFDVIPQNSQPWVRGYQIGTALGYGENADVSIRKLYTRHADEFTDAMTAVVTLPTEGGPQETRIFSLRGCHLLAMFARTPVAKAFRRWVLDVLDRMAAEERAALPEVPHIKITPSTAASRKPLRALVHAWAQISGTPHTALWPQVKAHFQLERIDDLPEEWIPDALEWVQGKIDEQRQALPPSPGSNPGQSRPTPAPIWNRAAPALAITDEIDVHLAAIREHIRHINDHEEAIFHAVRKGMPPLSGTGPRSSLALQIRRNMENAGWSLHYALKSMEASARTALAAGRI